MESDFTAMILLKNANVYTPEPIGIKDILIGGGEIIMIDDLIEVQLEGVETYDLEGQALLPGNIDQHIHLIGAGGGRSYASMTEEVSLEDLIACGSTTVVGLLGTDGSTRTLQHLYAKTQMLNSQGVTAYMFTNYYGYPTISLTETVKTDMVFIEPVIGCKIAISDYRSSYPSNRELARLASEVNIGGMISGKKGVLHIHLGNMESGMNPLFDLVEDYDVPIRLLSPTHVGRSERLFLQALKFAKMGGMIDITTGASQFVAPWEQVLMALDQGVSIDQITFSTDGHAGLGPQTVNGVKGRTKAPVYTNLEQVIALIEKGGVSPGEAFKLITKNPAKNLNLGKKGKIAVGMSADLCVYDEQWKLISVLACGKFHMKDLQYSERLLK